LPVAAVANVVLRFAHERYTGSRLYAGVRQQAAPDGATGTADAPPGADDVPPDV
jgi:hypothetical protein